MPSLTSLARAARAPSILALIGALVSLLAVPVAASAAGTLDQSQESASEIAAAGVGGGSSWAQTFTAGSSGYLDHVDLRIGRFCDPGDLTVEIRTTSGGKPTSTVLASATVPSSSVPAVFPSDDADWVSVPFTSPPPSVDGTEYAIVLRSAGTCFGSDYLWGFVGNNPYAAGQAEFSSDGGATWNAAGLETLDATFRTYVVTTAPEATTDAATDVTKDSATLNGRVNPEGQATTYHFDYGTSTSYGSQTPTPSGDAGSGTSDAPESADLTGLTPNTTYHYRIVATNDSDTAYGADRTFTTDKAPPTATTGEATNVRRHASKLHGRVDPEGQATTYRFEYGTSKDYGKRTDKKSAGSGSSNKSVAQALKGLKPSTRYHYRIVAVNGSGTTFGQDRTFRTKAAPSPPSPRGRCAQGNRQSVHISQHPVGDSSRARQNGCRDLSAR